MNSFNQTNPISNYNEIILNLQDLGNNIQKIRERLTIILQQLLQNPEIKKLIINNIGLIKQYFAIQIQLNTLLKEKFNYIPFSNQYYEFIINLNQNLLIKITTLAAILQTGDNEKIEQYINSLSNIEMGGIYLTFGERLKDITAYSFEMIANKIRTFKPNELLDQTKNGLQNIQNILQHKLDSVSNQLQNTMKRHEAITNDNMNEPITNDNMNEPITNDTMNEPITNDNMNEPITNDNMNEPITNDNTNQKGGRKFKTIFHPELNIWVNIKSRNGIDAMLKYAYYN